MIRLSPKLGPGDAAKDFAVKDSKGIVHTLAEFSGKWLVLFFYPADFTSGCTRESCLFRDHHQDFKDAGAEVVGVSGDSEDSHGAFAAEHHLPYLLLSDPQALMRRAYTVPHILSRLSGRTTFVIDPHGVIRYVFDSRVHFQEHVSRTLGFLKQKPA